MDFINLREKYKNFIYKNFTITEDEQTIKIQYFFEIPQLAEFKPTIQIMKKNIKYKTVDEEYVKNIVFNLGMVEIISYWKCVCTENVIIECGNLNEEQKQWFKKLYYNGTGEFRYINNIHIEQKEFVNFITNENIKSIVLEKKAKDTLEGYIIPVGGGKDSIVTLEKLKESKANNYCLTVGGKAPVIECCKIAGYNENQIIEVNREIDNNLLELNKKGYLNGHTPFSSILAFLSYLIAYLTDKKYVALSNEASANESNVKGENINHQYSKSLEFEIDFKEYAEKYLKANVIYFSILRKYSELQIAEMFSKHKQYHKVFKSCNVGSKQIPWKWCCNCPKCLFVYIILSPFLEIKEIEDIFGENLFKKKELLETFIGLCGYGKIKPFECVGTFEEVNYAVKKAIEKYENKELPYLLEYYKNNYR